MQVHADKSTEVEKHAASQEGSEGKQLQVAPPPPFVDNRPQAIAQRKMQELANKSAQVQQGAEIQALANQATPTPLQRMPASGGGVIQMVWYEEVDDKGTVEEREGDKPAPGTCKPLFKHKSGKSNVWKRKGGPPVKEPSYEEKVGNLPERDDYDTTFTVDASLVRFSQDSIASTFSDGGNIATLRDQLKSGVVKSSVLPVLKVTMRKKKLVSVDNRRLWACKEAGVQITCKWATDSEIAARDFTAGEHGAAAIRVRG